MGAAGVDATACTCVAGIAVGVRERGAGEGAGGGQGAAGGSVQSDGVGGLGIDAFDDVDFARRRPVGAEGPEGGPDAADAAGHVGDVGDEETVSVGFVGAHADGASTTGWIDSCVVDAKVDGSVGVSCKTRGVGETGAGVADEAIRWISSIEEVEL